MDELGEQNIDVKRKQSQLIDMDRATDTCKYEYQCIVTIIRVKVISGHLVKRLKSPKIPNMTLQYMFLGQIIAKNAKYDTKALLKKKNSKSHVWR